MSALALRITEAEEARPNIHRALADADIKGVALNKFAVFALGWFGNVNPDEAVSCFRRYQQLQSEGKLS